MKPRLFTFESLATLYSKAWDTHPLFRRSIIFLLILTFVYMDVQYVCVFVFVFVYSCVYSRTHTRIPAVVLLSFHLSQQIHVSAPGNSQLSSLKSQVSSALRVVCFTENPQARVPSKLGQMKIRHKVCVTLKRNCKLCITSFFDYHAAIIET